MEYIGTKRPSQLYMKLFWTYTSIALVVVSILAGYFLTETRQSVLEWNEENAQRIVRETMDYIQDKAFAAEDMYTEIYRNAGILEDLINFMEMEPEEYQKYRLSRYSFSAAPQYNGMREFFTESFETYPTMKKIEVLSYSTQKVTTCYADEVFYPYKDASLRLRKLTMGDENDKADELQFRKEIRDPDDMSSVGCLIMTFGCKNIFKGIEEHSEYMDALLSGNYADIICSEGDIEVLKEIMWKDAQKKDLRMPGYRVYREAADNYQVYLVLDTGKAGKVEYYKIFTILGVSAAALAIGILCINLYLRRLNRRVETIVQGMAKVTTGDLQVRLYSRPDGDELDIISGKFNKMCENLQTYIEKSYLAEIEAKDAELEALQSQINPHFLYNTLEAIRMKAIVNGDREVGKMLYSMSVLFRSQLKEADWITVGQELDYSKQYLGLFEMRYQGNFDYEIDCPVEILGVKVIKFMLQPILENYFIHGIRRQENGNHIHIRALEKDGDIYFHVADNGMGMTPERIQDKNRELRENRNLKNDRTKSIGISNVNRRIKAVYGEEYGIQLRPGPDGGLEVILHVRKEER